MSNLYKIIVSVVVLLVIVVGTHFMTFNLAISDLKDGIKDGNITKLEESIDFNSVRTDLKEQLNAAMMEKFSKDEELKKNPFGSLAMAFGGKMVDGMIDSYVTPYGMSKLINGERNNIKINKNDTESSKKDKEIDFYKKANFESYSLNKITLSVPDKNNPNEKTFMEFNRDFFNWKLVKIRLPLDNI